MTRDRAAGAALVRANALTIPLRAESVDLVVTSPPYFGQRSYRDGDEHYEGQVGAEATPTEFLRALWLVMDELWRVLKPAGVVVVNLGDKYAGSGGGNDQTGLGPIRGEQVDDVDRRGGPRRYVQTHASKDRPGEARAKSVLGIPWRFALGASMPHYYRAPFEPELADWPAWINRRPLVWEKPNGMPESVEDRPRNNVEDWLVFTKSERYFAALDYLRPELGDGWLGRLPGSVWTIPTEPLVVPDGLPKHFAAFPVEWPRRLIRAFSPSGICSACGAGRRPVAEKPRDVDFECLDVRRGPGAVGIQQTATGKEGAWGKWNGGPSARIVGEVCACTPYVDHPARPGNRPTEQERSAELGQRDNPGGGLGNYEATGARREYDFAGWTPPPTSPAVVLDPFGGTGTTALVANALGRFGVSLDLSADYLRLARWRVFESDADLKVVGRTYGQAAAVLEDGRRRLAAAGLEELPIA